MSVDELDDILGQLPPEERAVIEIKKKVKAKERELLGQIVAEATTKSLQPLVDEVKEAAEAIKKVTIAAPEIPPITIPEIKIPEVKVPPIEVKIPKIEVPVPQVKVECQPPEVKVNIPPQKSQPAPIVNVPKEVEIKGLKKLASDLLGAIKRVFDVRVTGVDRKNPLHVVLVAPGTDKEPEPYEYKAEFKGGIYAGGKGGGITQKVTVSHYRNIDLDENGVLVSAGAHKITSGWIRNRASTERVIKIYDKSSAPTSSDTPHTTITLDGGMGTALQCGPDGWDLLNGFGLRATTGIADNDTGAPAVNDVVVNLFYV